MLELRFKEAIISYIMHSPFVRWVYGQLVTEFSHKIVKSWLQPYWNLVFNSNEKPDAKINLGILNHYVGVKVLKFPKNNFQERTIMLTFEVKLYMMTTH